MTRNACEPSAMDDFVVSTIRRSEPDYLKDDPRFSEKAMNERNERGIQGIKEKFEAKYSI